MLILRDDSGPHAGTAHCYHLRRQLDFIFDPWSPSRFFVFCLLLDSAWERDTRGFMMTTFPYKLHTCTICFHFLATLNGSEMI